MSIHHSLKSGLWCWIVSNKCWLTIHALILHCKEKAGQAQELWKSGSLIKVKDKMSCMKATYCLLAHLDQLKVNLVVSFSLRILHVTIWIGFFWLPLMFGIYFSSSEFSKLLGQFQPIKALICKKGCKLFKFK